MTVLDQLLAAQSRSAAEAERITQAVQSGITAAVDDDGDPAAAADHAYRREINAIAAERNPRPSRQSAGHTSFGDEPGSPLEGFSDAEPVVEYPQVTAHFAIRPAAVEAEAEAVPAADEHRWRGAAAAVDAWIATGRFS